MTKTVKQVLERVRNKGFNDRCQQEKYADIDNQFVVALSVDQALKELEAIMSERELRARIDELNSLPYRSVTALTSSVDQSVIYERLDELKQELEKL